MRNIKHALRWFTEIDDELNRIDPVAGRNHLRDLIYIVAKTMGSTAPIDRITGSEQELIDMISLWQDVDDVSAIYNLVSETNLAELFNELAFIEDNEFNSFYVVHTIYNAVVTGIYYDMFKESHCISGKDLLESLRSGKEIH